GQHTREQRLAIFSRDSKLDAGDELERHLVDHSPVDTDVEPRFLGFAAGSLPQPQLTLRITVGKRDRTAVETERHQAGRGGNRQQLGKRFPGERAAERVLSLFEPERRGAIAERRRLRLAVDPDILGPTILLTGKWNPPIMIEPPVLR